MSNRFNRTVSGVPQLMVWLSWIIITVSFVILIAGAIFIGVTWDEKNQVMMLQTFFDRGWHMTEDALLGNKPDPAFIFGVFVYGPVGEFLPHAVAVLTGQESWGQQAYSAGAYAARHVGIAIQAFLGIVAVGGIVQLITRSWRLAILAAAVISSIPLWIGHGMMNIKDIPSATGYTIATLGLVALMRDDYFTDRKIRSLALGSIVTGAILAAGTRTAIGLPIAAAIVGAFIIQWLVARRVGKSEVSRVRPVRRFFEGTLAISVGYLGLLAIYPKAFVDPIGLGIKAVLESALYPVSEAQLTAGVWMTQPVSWSYLPLWFGAQLPILVIIGTLVGVVWWLRQLWRATFPVAASQNSREFTVQLFPVSLQLLLLPLAAMIGGATLYNGTRQMLFVVPAAAVFTTIAMWRLSLFVVSKGWLRGLKAMWIGVSLGLIVPVVSQIFLFPYSYTYFNAVAAIAPIDGNWTTDYWRASGNELWRMTPEGGRVSCAFEQQQKGEIFLCETQPMFQPFLEERGDNAGFYQLEANEYWYLQENNGFMELPPGCRIYDKLTRPLFLRDITIGQIAICDDRIDTGQRNMQDPSDPIRKAGSPAL